MYVSAYQLEMYKSNLKVFGISEDLCVPSLTQHRRIRPRIVTYVCTNMIFNGTTKRSKATQCNLSEEVFFTEKYHLHQASVT